MTEIIEFVPIETPQELWQSFHAFRRLRHEEADAEYPFTIDSVVEADLKEPPVMSEPIRYFVVDSGRVIGFGRSTRSTPKAPDYEEQKQFANASVEILPEYRRQGLGKQVLRMLMAFWDAGPTTTLNLWTHENDGHRFLEVLGAEPRLFENENRLDLSKVDWDMVNDWAREPEGVTVELYEDRLPNSLLHQYCPVYTEISNDMPDEALETGEDKITPETWTEIYKWVKNVGGSHHTYLTREAGGEISALTDVMYIESEPEFVHQWATGVLRKYRGRGLGKLVKARMLLYIRQRYPRVRWILTENAGSNEPMLAINHKLGFYKHREAVCYQIGVEDLRSALSA